MTTIGSNAFFGYTMLESALFPSVTDIGDSAFDGCINLTEIFFPKAATLGNNAFNGCSAIAVVNFPMVTMIGVDVFAGCPIIEAYFDAMTDVPVGLFDGFGTLESVSFRSATTIGDGAFRDCISLTSVTIPNAISIGNDAFRDCSSLIRAEFLLAQHIGADAFHGCTSLSYVSFPAAESIGSFAFSGTIFTSIELPKSTVLDADAFTGTAIKTVTVLNYGTGTAMLDAFKASGTWGVAGATTINKLIVNVAGETVSDAYAVVNGATLVVDDGMKTYLGKDDKWVLQGGQSTDDSDDDGTARVD